MTNIENSRNNNKTATAEGTTSGTTTINNSTTTTYTQSRAFFWTDADLEMISSAFLAVMNQEINSTIGHFLHKCMNRGMKVAVVLDAIERTGWAKSPSPFYLRAILDRYLKNNILTMEDVQADEQDRYMDKRRKQYVKETGWFY